MSEATAREKIEGMKEIPANEQFMGHHQRAVEEVLGDMILDRIEAIENHLHEKFGELP